MAFRYTDTICATGVEAITPNDSTVLATTRGLYVGGAGNVAIQAADGTTATLSGVVAGTVLPIQVVKVNATGTTATNIVALR